MRWAMKGTFPLGTFNTNEEDETLATSWYGSPHPTPQGMQWMVTTKQTPGKVTWGRYRRNYQSDHRERAQELICGGLIIWKNLFGLLETLAGWTYWSIPEASEWKWTRCIQVSAIGIKGADTVGTLHQRALRSVFGDDKQPLRNKLALPVPRWGPRGKLSFHCGQSKQLGRIKHWTHVCSTALLTPSTVLKDNYLWWKQQKAWN